MCMTFSIVGFDPETADCGVGVQSKFLCVGSLVPWVKSHVGAVATQALINCSYGPRGLELLQQGLSASEVVESLVADDQMRECRQVGVVDAQGNSAAFTGKECFSWAGHRTAKHYCCQGNILYSHDTVDAMAWAFENSHGDLATKLLAALIAADKEGRGDIRGKQSAALVVAGNKGFYNDYNDRFVDIRVDDHPEPIQELQRIFELFDLTFLNREPPGDLLPIEGACAKKMKEVLYKQGYLQKRSNDTVWGEAENNALYIWTSINNFENKWHSDGKIWKSVYTYLCNEKGTPFIQLQKMND